ncbi:MAG: NAD-dependent deacylase [Deltaproteobacteria bacterium]|nr:NAD-dependent deacylase [Deltaproteobacteria bacterium]
MTLSNIALCKEQLGVASSVAILTGAGISAESGVPTFRGNGGLWRDMRAETLATPEAFEENPVLVWEFYDWRRTKLIELEPNPAHRALASLEKKISNFLLITQNVDDLHRLGGSKKTLELHGNIWRTRCTKCLAVEENKVVPIFRDKNTNDATPSVETLPRCRCKGLLRPDIVWFGESLQPGIFEEAIRAVTDSEVMLVIGTSGVVEPAASLATLAKQSNSFVIEVNPEKTPISPIADITITENAAYALPLMIPA